MTKNTEKKCILLLGKRKGRYMCSRRSERSKIREQKDAPLHDRIAYLKFLPRYKVKELYSKYRENKLINVKRVSFCMNDEHEAEGRFTQVRSNE